MLDKSIPYQNIIMCAERENLLCLKEPTLPSGFSFRLFCPDDEKQWARLEWQVGEFATEKEAIDYFSQNYLAFETLLRQRCWFIWDEEKDQAAATATAWFEQVSGGERLASLHWVSTAPYCQRKGLGRAIVVQALKTLAQTENSQLVYLHTQTWSHQAVRLYLSLGFGAVRQGSFSRYSNDYPLYLSALWEKMPLKDYETFLKNLV